MNRISAMLCGIGVMQLALAPVPTAPVLGVPVVHSSPAVLTLSWKQFELTSVSAPPVDRFVICIFAPPRQSCENTPHRWTVAANALPRQMLFSEVRPSFYRQIVGYLYTFEFLLPPDLPDRPLQWTVSSCATSAADSCAVAAPDNLKPPPRVGAGGTVSQFRKAAAI